MIEFWTYHDIPLAMREYKETGPRVCYDWTTAWAFFSPITGEIFARRFIEGPKPKRWITFTQYDTDELADAPPLFRQEPMLFSHRVEERLNPGLYIPVNVLAIEFLRHFETNYGDWQWENPTKGRLAQTS